MNWKLKNSNRGTRNRNAIGALIYFLVPWFLILQLLTSSFYPVARSSRKHYINFAIFSLFVLAFGSFLVIAAYYYFSGAENMTVKSFAPGVPAFFLFFLARKEWRSAKAARNMEKRRAKSFESEV